MTKDELASVGLIVTNLVLYKQENEALEAQLKTARKDIEKLSDRAGDLYRECSIVGKQLETARADAECLRIKMEYMELNYTPKPTACPA